MGLFDIFKHNQKNVNLSEEISEVAFPRGRIQVESEVAAIRMVLKDHYPKDYVAKTFLIATNLCLSMVDKSEDTIVNILMQSGRIRLSKEDVKITVSYIQHKFKKNGNREKTLSEKILDNQILLKTLEQTNKITGKEPTEKDAQKNLGSMLNQIAYANKPAELFRLKAIDKFFDEKEYDEAIIYINKGLEFNDSETDPLLYDLRAECYLLLNNYKQALSDINKAIELNEKRTFNEFYNGLEESKIIKEKIIQQIGSIKTNTPEPESSFNFIPAKPNLRIGGRDFFLNNNFISVSKYVDFCTERNEFFIKCFRKDKKSVKLFFSREATIHFENELSGGKGFLIDSNFFKNFEFMWFEEKFIVNRNGWLLIPKSYPSSINNYNSQSKINSLNSIPFMMEFEGVREFSPIIKFTENLRANVKTVEEGTFSIACIYRSNEGIEEFDYPISQLSGLNLEKGQVVDEDFFNDHLAVLYMNNRNLLDWILVNKDELDVDFYSRIKE